MSVSVSSAVASVRTTGVFEPGRRAACAPGRQELSNPLDPSSEPTGNTSYVLTGSRDPAAGARGGVGEDGSPRSPAHRE